MNTETETETKSTNETSLIERLFSAGAHFGFTKSRRHPTVVPFIFGSKHGTDIIDLEKTSELLTQAKQVVADVAKNGKVILFVCTKEEVSPIVKAAAEKAEMPYVTNRWIGGALTNFSEIKKRLARLAALTEQGESGELERKYTKKERVVIGRELQKLNFNFGGIKKIERTPDLLVVVDPRHNSIAVDEALQLNIPVVGVTSSDANIGRITHPIVVNDSLQASITLVMDELVAAILDGKASYTPPAKQENTRENTRKR